MTGLELGGPAPDFTLRDQFGQDVSLSSYRDKKAVAILFYPYAFSGVCTGEPSLSRILTSVANGGRPAEPGASRRSRGSAMDA